MEKYEVPKYIITQIKYRWPKIVQYLSKSTQVLPIKCNTAGA